MSAIELRYPNIRERREELHMTQSDVAKHIHTSQVSYSYYEIGKRDIPTGILIEIANLFNCSIDYLLGRTKNKKLYS